MDLLAPCRARRRGSQDHFRKVVKPAYTNVFRDRGDIFGVVEFENEEDLDYAIRWGRCAGGGGPLLCSKV